MTKSEKVSYGGNVYIRFWDGPTYYEDHFLITASEHDAIQAKVWEEWAVQQAHLHTKEKVNGGC